MLTASEPQATYELAGGQPFTLTELASEVSRVSGKTITHLELPEGALRDALVSFGLPAEFAEILVDADRGIARGELDDSSKTLSKLIGRPTTSLAAVLAQTFSRSR